MKRLIFSFLLAAGIFLTPLAALAAPIFSPAAPTSTAPQNTISVTWARTDDGVTLDPLGSTTAKGHGYHFAFSRLAGVWSLGIAAGVGYSLFESQTRGPDWQHPLWFSTKAQYLGARGGMKLSLGRGVELKIGVAVAQTQTWRRSKNQSRAAKSFVRFRGDAKVIFHARGWAVVMGASQEPWHIFTPGGAIDAPIDLHLAARVGGLGVALNHEVSRGAGAPRGYNFASVIWYFGGNKVTLGKSWAENMYPRVGLGAAQTAISPSSPWLAYQGGNFVAARLKITPGLSMNFMYFRGQPPRRKYGVVLHAGGSQISAGLTWTF